MPRKLKSFEEFHKMVPLVIRKLNKDKNLAIRAVINPMYAIEELGFELSPEVKKEIELRIRFSDSG